MADVLADLKNWSATASSNLPAGSTALGTGLDDNLRQLQATVRQDLASVGANIASNATCDLGAIAGLFHTITGTTGITSFGTVAAGIWKILRFADVVTITHNGTSLVCPYAANITTAAGDGLLCESLGSGNWKVYPLHIASLYAALAGLSTQTFSVAAATAAAHAVRLDQTMGKNIVINGGFTINQRGYVSGAALAAGNYGHDRFKAGAGGGDYSFTQLASNTTITIAANKTLIQVVEDKNVHSTSYVLSWTGTAQARYAVNSATPAGAYAASPILITGQTAGTTMSIEFGNGASAGTLGKVQLEAGGVATTFEARPYSVELALCQRYLPVLASGNTDYIAAGSGYDANDTRMPVIYKTEARVVPTGVFASNVAHFAIITGSGTGTAVTGITFSAGGVHGCLLTLTHTGGGVTNAATLFYSTSASALLYLTGCEL